MTQRKKSTSYPQNKPNVLWTIERVVLAYLHKAFSVSLIPETQAADCLEHVHIKRSVHLRLSWWARPHSEGGVNEHHLATGGEVRPGNVWSYASPRSYVTGSSPHATGWHPENISIFFSGLISTRFRYSVSMDLLRRSIPPRFVSLTLIDKQMYPG